MSQLSELLSNNQNKNVEELKELLRIPSISSLSEHKEDIQKAASWISNKLKTIGMEHVEIIQTKGHPIIYADWIHQENAPTVLVYGHYDVQPVDPVDLWETPPFEPTIRDEKIFARGATDDKGQMFLHIKAVETLNGIRWKITCKHKILHRRRRRNRKSRIFRTFYPKIKKNYPVMWSLFPILICGIKESQPLLVL